MLAPLPWLLLLAASVPPAGDGSAAAPARPAARADGGASSDRARSESDARSESEVRSESGVRSESDARSESNASPTESDARSESDASPTDASEQPEPDDDLVPPKPRRFALGLEGVVLQATPLRPEVVRFDPRFVGRSVSMAGLGLFARYRLHPRIAIEATVRSGSVRYAASGDDPDVVSQDQVMADAGVLLFVAQGEMARLAFDAGLGGMGTRVRYELDREGTQRFGSGLVRVGVDAEFVLERIVFVVSFRTLGVFTRRDAVRSFGPLLEGKDLLAPVPALQTQLVGSAGLAYRF